MQQIIQIKRYYKEHEKQKSVPWWTEELTIKRKKLSDLRRRYQRTKSDEELRKYRKNIYYEEKTISSNFKKGNTKIVERKLT
jgi:predicted CopG family antitoxin